MRSKERALCLAAGILLFVWAPIGRAETTVSYENKSAGVRLDYPSDWIKSESLAGAVVAFGVPKEKANLKMVENVSVVVQELPVNITSLEQYTAMYDVQRKKNSSAVQVLESKKTTLAGQPAQKIVCLGKQGGLDIQFMQVWTVKKGKAYLCTYGAEQGSYRNFLKEAERIIASLKFI